MKRKCDNCGSEYNVKPSDLKRGWGLTCSKSCAASKRERSKPSYNVDRVKRNNIIRDNWNDRWYDDYDPADDEYWSNKDY